MEGGDYSCILAFLFVLYCLIILVLIKYFVHVLEAGGSGVLFFAFCISPGCLNVKETFRNDVHLIIKRNWNNDMKCPPVCAVPEILGVIYWGCGIKHSSGIHG